MHRLPPARTENPAPGAPVVRRQSREFCQSVFVATVVLERDPVILKLADSGVVSALVSQALAQNRKRGFVHPQDAGVVLGFP